MVCLLTLFGTFAPFVFPKYSLLLWWQTTVVYQIYSRAYQDSDGDGLGDLRGTYIVEKLHLMNIGVKAVWLNPIYKSPMLDFGYDIQNITDIDPIFGTLDDFIQLQKALEAHDIKLVLDLVPNHSSDKHIWLQISIKKIDPYTDYYVWARPKGKDDDGNPIPPNNWLSYFGGSAWEYVEERGEFYLHQYAVQQPDFNCRNPTFAEDFLDILRFLFDISIGGFRVDAVASLMEDEQLRDEPPSEDLDALPDDYKYLPYLHGQFTRDSRRRWEI